jgi:hypothetical protein
VSYTWLNSWRALYSITVWNVDLRDLNTSDIYHCGIDHQASIVVEDQRATLNNLTMHDVHCTTHNAKMTSLALANAHWVVEPTCLIACTRNIHALKQSCYTVVHWCIHAIAWRDPCISSLGSRHYTEAYLPPQLASRGIIAECKSMEGCGITCILRTFCSFPCISV